MSQEIICTNCQTANTPGSKFCNNCGERLPLSTSLICPNCSTPNPRNRFYCDNCGTRLVKDTAKPEEPETGKREEPDTGSFFSLPVRPPGETGDLDPLQIVPDWLEKQGQEDDDEDVPRQHMPKIEEVGPSKKVTDDLPDWLVDEHDADPIIGSPRVITTKHYMNLMREPKEDVSDDLAETADNAELPDWLSGIADPPDGEKATQSDDRSTTDDALSEWLASISGEDAADDSQPDEASLTPDEPDTPEPASDFFDALVQPDDAEDEDEADVQTGWLFGDDDNLEDEADFKPIETDSLSGLEAEDQALGSEVFDWLSENLTETGSLAQPTFPEEEAGTELDDWLANLSGQDTAGKVPELEAELSGKDEDDSLAGWLDADEFEAVDTDMLAGLTDAVAQQDMNKPDEALPGWMAELAGQEETDEGETAVPGAERLPDWMSEYTASDTDQFEEELSAKLEAMDDDLAETAVEPKTDSWLDDRGAAPEAEQLPAAEPNETGPLPDWLTGVSDEESLVSEDSDDTLFTGLFAADEAADDSLDWFTDEETAPAEPKPTADEMADDSLLGDTDWLAEMVTMGEEAFALDEPAEEPEPSAETETPVEEAELTFASPEDDLFSFDWSEEEAEEEQPETPAKAEITDSTWKETDSLLSAALDEEMPDWIDELGPPVASESSPVVDEELPTSESLPDWIAQMKPGSVFTDTETGLTDSVGLPDLSDELPELTDELLGAELPDWLQIDSDAAAELDSKAGVPDWLDIKPEAGGSEGGLFGLGGKPPVDTILQNLPPAPPIEERVIKANIPDWILALKPSDSIEEEEPAEPLESGPLAGLTNILQIETAVVEPQEELTAFFKITPEQQSQAALLKQLAMADRKVAQPIGAAESAPAFWIRLVLVALLLLAVLAGLLRPNLLQRAPAAVPSYLATAHTAVAASSGLPVLLAIEYTPAMSAELDPQAEMLLAQLAANNNSIMTVSQSAAGTAVIQRVAGDYPTLGLLPGQAVGLRQLSDCLTTACPTLTGKTLTGSMQQSLADVALIIVLTGERDSLVDWLEQVAMTSDVPVVAGVTQSLGPVAAPYLDSDQLQGMIAGLPDTAVYQQELLNQPPDNNIMRQLSAQTLGQLLAATLLLAGGLVYGIANLIKRENGS